MHAILDEALGCHAAGDDAADADDDRHEHRYRIARRALLLAGGAGSLAVSVLRDMRW